MGSKTVPLAPFWAFPGSRKPPGGRSGGLSQGGRPVALTLAGCAVLAAVCGGARGGISASNARIAHSVHGMGDTDGTGGDCGAEWA
ncbi:hypothetical protein PP641_gp001 [Arthrobacter phage SilentRX]|uniref:Uncharacterized protein n=1 Tax=Arthrobacter phage SilentRX TaxID=2836091 RepID=A0A8F3E7N7_9CAUD|nr:hypothetical protein PP641_gp001 [Arthrobacter phage SilentRX]QWY82848.1 hypothetical protein SEA_SILENTRX_1 [Arthrobacter phage SilentRX]